MNRRVSGGLSVLLFLELIAGCPAQGGARADARDAPPKRPDAALTYRMALREFAAERGGQAAGDSYRSPSWRAEVERTALARTLFEQAAAQSPCRLGVASGGRDGGYRDLVLPLYSLAEAVLADGWQRLYEHPAHACRTAELLLAHTRHLASISMSVAQGCAFDFERKAADLIEALCEHAAATGDESLATRLCAVVEHHLAERATLAVLADRLMAEARRGLAELGGADPRIDARARELLVGVLDLLRDDVPVRAAEAERLRSAFIARLLERRAALVADDDPGSELRERQAVERFRQLCPPLARLLAEREAATEQLTTCREQLVRWLDRDADGRRG